MGTNITIVDLRMHKETLEKTLQQVCENFMDCLIYEELDTYCTCGCNNLSIANLLFRVKKPNVIRVYGLKIYPTKNCQPVIINCDNRGLVIKYEIYKATKSWLQSIPREMERQQQRVDIIKRELLERTDSGVPEEQNLNFII